MAQWISLGRTFLNLDYVRRVRVADDEPAGEVAVEVQLSDGSKTYYRGYEALTLQQHLADETAPLERYALTDLALAADPFEAGHAALDPQALEDAR
jgi:hypothetical protein